MLSLCAVPQITYARRTMQLGGRFSSCRKKVNKNDDEVQMDGSGEVREFIISQVRRSQAAERWTGVHSLVI